MSFIYVGRLNELKGIKILFKAWKIMEDNSQELRVCGLGPLESWCKNFIDKHHLSRVSMLGFRPNKAAKKLIANSEALILPTQWYEGLPMTILEAYSLGTPVIGSDLGNVGNLVTEGITGAKFVSDSPDDLVQAVKRLQSYKHIRSSTYSVYKQLYSEKQNYKRLMEIYQNVRIL